MMMVMQAIDKDAEEGVSDTRCEVPPNSWNLIRDFKTSAQAPLLLLLCPLDAAATAHCIQALLNMCNWQQELKALYWAAWLNCIEM